MTALISSTMRRKLLLMLRLAATIAAVWLVLHFVDFGKLTTVLATLSYEWLLPIILLRLCFYFVRGLRIWQILRYISRRKLPILPVVGWFFVSSSVGLFTPAGVGDFTMAYFGRRFGVTFVEGGAAVLIDKLITLLVTIFIALIGIILYFPAHIMAFNVICFAIILILSCFYATWCRLDSKSPYKLAINKWIPTQIWATSKEILVNPYIFISIIVLVFFQAIIVTFQMVCALFLVSSVSVPFYGIFWLMGISRFLLQVPLTVGGLGVYEGSIVYLFKHLSIAPELSFIATLICRSITWLTSFAVVLSLLWVRPILRRHKHNASGQSFQRTPRM